MTTYRKLSDIEHILVRPSMYIGSVEKESRQDYVMNSEKTKFELKEITIVPGLLKTFDEIISNATDNAQRDHGMKELKVTIEDNSITVYNDGRNVPIVMHQEEQMYIPTMVFGHLRTSSNYDDTEQRTTVGTNGLGAKATNVFSSKFSIELYDSERQLKFQQTWQSNMGQVSKPKVTTNKSIKKSYICVSYIADYSRFGLEQLDDDHFLAMERRVYDAAATLATQGVKVTFNGKVIKIKTLKDYMALFGEYLYKKVNDQWEIGVGLNDNGNGLNQISFVNHSLTRHGGTHVDHVANLVANELIAQVRRKNKSVAAKNLKPAQVKNHMSLFVNCTIVNPTYDSQSKERMTKRPEAWGSICQVDSAFCKKLGETKLFEKLCEIVSKSEDKLIAKTDGVKKSTIHIEKLEDALWAGTKKSKECTLYIAEGDSAKGFVIKGISAIKDGRNKNGVYPLRGKVLNVRDKTDFSSNVELTNIKKILGLEHKRDYSTGIESLRYGSVAIISDADVDGDHIAALIVNFFDSAFPTLLKNNPGFLKEFVTPIVRCKRGNIVKSFFAIPEYEQFVEQELGGNTSGWNIKYYKGLATSQTNEIKEYFGNLPKHLKTFKPVDEIDSEKIDIVFNKKRVAERKEWLKTYNPKVFRDQRLSEHKINDFFDQGLIHFSIADNVRSIPSLVDGLKVSQRKILWTMLKKGMVGEAKEIKVAQLAGDVANFTHYHHGEQSLAMAIILMAQNFVGTNNLNMLYPSGDFGTRMEGPTKTGAPRYIYTYLEPWARTVFHPEDDNVLDMKTEEGHIAEPWVMYPIIPMSLVNGAEGIGSGFSTFIPPFSVKDVIAALRQILGGQGWDNVNLAPHYNGFSGRIVQDGPDKWSVFGTFTRTGPYSIRITELPLKWSGPYKEFLVQLVQDKKIKGFKNFCDEHNIKFEIDLFAEWTDEKIMEEFKLSSSFRTSNMVLFDSNGVLKQYMSPVDILREFYVVRLEMYAKRKEFNLQKWNVYISELRSKLRFVEHVLQGKYQLGKMELDHLEQLMVQDGFDNPKDLLRMSIHSMTKTKMTQLKKEIEDLDSKIQVYTQLTSEQLWLHDLDRLESVLQI